MQLFHSYKEEKTRESDGMKLASKSNSLFGDSLAPLRMLEVEGFTNRGSEGTQHNFLAVQKSTVGDATMEVAFDTESAGAKENAETLAPPFSPPPPHPPIRKVAVPPTPCIVSVCPYTHQNTTKQRT